MAATPSDDASAHVLDAAERVFLERGYAGTRMRDLAAALDIRPPSLYHHAPGGKAELWDRVVGRALARHERGLRAAAEDAGPDLRRQLCGMADWLLSQPPVNVVAVAQSQIAGGPEAEAHATAERMYGALMVPVADVVREAAARGEVREEVAPDLFAGAFVTAVSGLLPTVRAGSLPRPAQDLGREIVDLLLGGALPR